MKKLIYLMIFSLLLMVGCNNIPTGDDCDFLINAKWEGTDEQCTNYIRFEDDMSFGNYCACGSPVGDGDLTEIFRYIENGQSLLLYDCDEVLVEEGQILFCDDTYLVVNLWGMTYSYQNTNKEAPTTHKVADDILKKNETTKPCVYILGLDKDILTVSSHNYDGDAKDNFETWQLPIAKDVQLTSATTNIINGVASLDVSTLNSNDLSQIGEDFTYGYCEFNDEGEVISIIFYGETEVWDNSL